MTDTNEDTGTNALQAEPVVENLESTQVPEAAIEENLENPAEIQPEAPKEHGNKGKPAWWQDRINEVTNQKRLLKTQLDQERREKQEAQALIERLQGGDKDRAPARQEDIDIDALVEARAASKLFEVDCNAVANAWQSELPESFKSSLDILGTVGILPNKDGTNTEFMEDILAVDKSNAHKILDALAQNPERALSMRNMNSRSRIAALTRMQMTETAKPALTAPAPKPSISKVPPPKPVIDAVSDDSGETDLTNDKLDDRTWSKIWDKKYNKRA